MNGIYSVEIHWHIKILFWDNSESKQSGRSPKAVALFTAANYSSYNIELLQLHDTIQIKWQYAWIHYNIAIRSYWMIQKYVICYIWYQP